MMIIDNRTVAITHPTKLMFPDDGVTKRQLVEYYAKIFPYMAPFLSDRPLVLVRYIEGINGEGFYQKEAGTYFPGWIKRTPVKLVQGGTEHLVVADSAATLAYLANQGTITYHIWSSTTHALHKPDTMVFDLDPSDNDFSKVRMLAHILKGTLEDGHGYHTRLMTTGSRGLHILIPIAPNRDFDAVRDEARAIAQEVAAVAPDIATVEAHVAKRGKRVYIDTTRNAYGQTHVAPYSLRARPSAPVATPLEWTELTDELDPQKYTIHTILRRLAHKPNPWNI